MVQQGQYNLGILKNVFLIGFGAIALGLYLQRKKFSQYGYNPYALKVADSTKQALFPNDIDPAAMGAGINAKVRAWIEAKTDQDLHIDTRKDNRFLFIKDDAGHYVAYIQANDNHYYKTAVLDNNPAIHEQLSKIKFKDDPTRINTKTHNLIERAINATEDLGGDDHRVSSNLTAENKKAKWEQEKFEAYMDKNGKGLFLFGAAAVATKAPMIAQQMMGSGSYALMNKAGSPDGRQELKTLMRKAKNFLKI